MNATNACPRIRTALWTLLLILSLGLVLLTGCQNSTVLPGTVGHMDKQYKITLESSLADDLYTLRYEGVNGILPDYADICTLRAGESFTGFVSQNIAPVDASQIGVYNSANERVGSISFVPSVMGLILAKETVFGLIERE